VPAPGGKIEAEVSRSQYNRITKYLRPVVPRQLTKLAVGTENHLSLAGMRRSRDEQRRIVDDINDVGLTMTPSRLCGV
jgi:hypothetical protein